MPVIHSIDNNWKEAANILGYTIETAYPQWDRVCDVYVITDSDGDSVTVSAPKWNKRTHREIRINFKKDDKGTESSINCDSSHSVNKDTDAKKLAKRLETLFGIWKPIWKESQELANKSIGYNNSVKSTLQRIDAVGIAGRVDIGRQLKVLDHVGTDGYGQVFVGNSSCNLELNNIAHDLAIKILQFIRKQ